MRLHNILATAAGVVATLVDDDGHATRVDIDVTPDQLLAMVARRAKLPEAEKFTDDENAQLAALRAMYEATKEPGHDPRTFEKQLALEFGKDAVFGLGKVQLELQRLLQPLETKERAQKAVEKLTALSKGE